jgi:poly-gamma-glutamate synthesis protein (capsule biosynthesis protein)
MISSEKYKIIPAKSLAPGVPPALSALRFYGRSPVGRVVRLFAVGDIGLSGSVRDNEKHIGRSALFSEVTPLLQSGDLAFANLESSLIDFAPKGSLFSGLPSDARILKEAGFSILHLANNHIYDYGESGLNSTLSAFEEHGLVPLGAGNDLARARGVVRTNVKELRIGWLGCGRTDRKLDPDRPSYWELDERELLHAVRAARDKVDIVVVSLHMGFMYLDYPHPDDRAMAKKLIEEGAHLILIHHAHVLQGVEVTNGGGIICYNLGNFLLDWEEGNVRADVMVELQREGAVFFFEIDQRGICLAAALPTFITDSCCVRWATGERGTAILGRLNRISQDLEGPYARKFWQQRVERNTGHAIRVIWFHVCARNWGILLRLLEKIRFKHFRMGISWIGTFFRVLKMKGLRPRMPGQQETDSH